VRRILAPAAAELIWGIVPLAVVLVAWQIAWSLIPSNSFLRSPLEAFGFLTSGENAGELGAALGSTFTMLGIGYLIAVAVAFALAAVMAAWEAFARASMPLLTVLGVVPVIVIGPVVIMLVGRGPATSIVVCIMITFFPCLVSVLSGLRSASARLLELGVVLGASRWRTLALVRLPSAVPAALSASKLALPAALSGVILTEYIATGAGVGTFVNLARANFRYIDMWSGILVLVVLSIVAYTVLGIVERIAESALGLRRSPTVAQRAAR
jgi:ABC-type nitrate/sulfonate/bicarbonate transport system permease component